MKERAAVAALTQEELMAVRYHLRTSGFTGDHEAHAAELAADPVRLRAIVAAYRTYAGRP